MAGRIAGITIDIDGNTSKLESSLKSLDGSLRTTQNTLKDVNKLLKLDPGNTELLTQKQKNLESAIRGTKLRLNELKTAQEGVAEGTAEWDALQREIIATEQDLQGLEQEYRNFGSVGAQQVAAVGAKMEAVGGKIEGIGQKLAPVSAAAAGIVASLVGLGYSAITSADDLSTLAKQTGFSTDEIQRMQYAADLVDVSFEDISGALKKMKGKMDPANETFQQLGVSVTDANGELRDSSTVFYEAIEALSGIENETERDQVAMELFGKSADQLAGIIDDGGAALKQFGQDAEDMGLILDQETLDSLNAINDTVDKTKARFRGAFAKAGATLAQKFAPALDKAAAVAERLADKIANLSPETLGLITKIAGVVAAIAPVLVVGGKLTSGIGKVLSFAPQIKAAIAGVTAALSSPLGIAAAVVAAAILIYKNWDKIKELAGKVAETVANAWNRIKEAVMNSEIVQKAAEIWENLKTNVSNAVQNAKDFVVDTWNNIKDAVLNSDFIQGVVAAWESVRIGVQTAVRAVRTTVTGVWNRIKEIVSNNEFIEGVVAGWESLKAGVQAAVRAARTTVVTTWNTIKSRVQALTSNVAESVTSKFEEAKEAASTAVENARTAVVQKWNAIKTSVSSTVTLIANAIRSKFTVARNNVTAIFSTIKSSIEEKINNAKQAVSDAIEKIKGFFNFDLKIPDIDFPTWDSIKGKAEELWNNIKGVLGQALKLDFKLPKLKVTDAGELPWGILGKGRLPKLDVVWERKAYDNPVMFTKPTVLGTPNGNYGFGDGHGAEIVLGLNRLRELVGSTGQQVTINVYPPSGANVEQIAAAVEQRLVAAQQRRIRVYA